MTPRGVPISWATPEARVSMVAARSAWLRAWSFCRPSSRRSISRASSISCFWKRRAHPARMNRNTPMDRKLARRRQRACWERSGSRKAVPATATIQVRPLRSMAPLKARAAVASWNPSGAAPGRSTRNQRPLVA